MSAARLNCDARPCSSRLHSCGGAARATATGNLCGKAHWLCRPEERELERRATTKRAKGPRRMRRGHWLALPASLLKRP